MNAGTLKSIAVATALALTAPGAFAGDTRTYTSGTETLEGYAAPASTARANIVVLPTWKGISDYEKDRATMLANAGFNAFAADLHGAGKLPRTMEEMQAAYTALWSDPDRVVALVASAVEQAEAMSDLPVVVLGYSMGGGAAMELARTGRGNSLGVDGYAVFSGRVSDPQGRMMPEHTAPIFVAHGSDDARQPVSALINFEDDLDLAGIEHDIHVYDGRGHLFSAFGFPNYDAEADADSWAALMTFLDRILTDTANGS